MDAHKNENTKFDHDIYVAKRVEMIFCFGKDGDNKLAIWRNEYVCENNNSKNMYLKNSEIWSDTFLNNSSVCLGDMCTNLYENFLMILESNETNWELPKRIRILKKVCCF